MPRVFLSYAHSSAEHRSLVHALADQLRKHGLDAIFDGYVTGGPDEGWPQWCVQQIRNADFILAICSVAYCRRFEGTEQTEMGLGAAWEAGLLRQHLYEQRGNNHEFLPILFDGTPNDAVPDLLSRYHLFRLPGGYEELLRKLWNEPGIDKPMLGNRRVFLPARSSSPAPGLFPPLSESPFGTNGSIEQRLLRLSPAETPQIVVSQNVADHLEQAYSHREELTLAGKDTAEV